MKRVTRLISLFLAFAVMTAFCSCGNVNKNANETAAASVSVEETTAATTEPTPTPTPTPEPTSTPTPTPTPVPNFGLEEFCPVLSSCVGISPDEALKTMEKFLGVKLDDVLESTNYEDKPCYFINLKVIIEGVTFTNMYIQGSLDEDIVEFISITNPDLSPEEMMDRYVTFDDLLEELYGGSDLSVDDETVCYSLRTDDDDIIINTGYLIGDGGSFWLNASPE